MDPNPLLQWTPLHTKLRELLCYQRTAYKDCKAIIDILSKYVNNGTSNTLDAYKEGVYGVENLLFECFSRHNLPVMKLLLEAGADPFVSRKGQNLLHMMAYDKNCDYCFYSEDGSRLKPESLLRYDADVETNVTDHLLELYASMQDSVKKRAFVDAEDHMGLTPLIIAAKYGNYFVTAWLLENNAYVNARCGIGMTMTTAAHEAARNGHKDVLRLLLANGANPNIEVTLIPCVKVRDVANGNKDIIDLLDKFSQLKGSNTSRS